MQLMVNGQGGQTNLNISTTEVSMPEGLQNKDVTNVDIQNGDNKKYTKEEIIKAVDKLNRLLEDEKTHAEYSVHKDLNEIMIKIVDDETGKTVLEVPPKKILDGIAALCKLAGVLVDKKV